MDFFHKVATPSVFYAAAGMNMLAGAALFVSPMPIAEIKQKLAKKFGGNLSKVESDVALLKGAELQLRGKGVILFGVGSLLLCALATKDKKLLRTLVAAVAVGDVAMLALYAKAKQDDAEFPRLESEKKFFPLGLGYVVAEALAFGSYAFYCMKH